MTVPAAVVKELRQLTGVGILQCKKALEEVGGDLESAKEVLRKKGADVAVAKAARATEQGVISSYIHHNGRLGALVELGCETDFVARTDDFRRLGQDIARQVAAYDPCYLSPDEVPDSSEGSGKEQILLLQPFVSDESITIGDLIQQTIAKTGENIRVRRFVRFQVGG